MTRGFDKDLFEKTLNDILPGLTMYVRDANLSPICAEKYHSDMIIMERGFTDASNRVMGMVTSHRFAILSNHMADLREYEHGTNWGLFVAQRNSHFLILDVYKYQGHTQILLLHLPNDKRWKLFINTKADIIDSLIDDCRKRFRNKLVQHPVPELTTNDWLNRCAAPLGMDDNGILFDLNPSFESMLAKVDGSSFRAFYHHFIYLENGAVLEKVLEDSLTSDDTGAIVYGYIDEMAGLSFQIVELASLKNNKLRTHKLPNHAMYVIRYGNIKNHRYLDLSQIDMDLTPLKGFEQAIRKQYDTENKDKEIIRSLEFLDPFRFDEHPDDIAVILFKEGLKPEQVWVRGNRVNYDHKIFGELLNEPSADFGVHKGDSIPIVIYQRDDNSLICVSLQS